MKKPDEKKTESVIVMELDNLLDDDEAEELECSINKFYFSFDLMEFFVDIGMACFFRICHINSRMLFGVKVTWNNRGIIGVYLDILFLKFRPYTGQKSRYNDKGERI